MDHVLVGGGRSRNWPGFWADFLITAIALLFDRKDRESVHTIALFSAAVLILMLDSYLFSLITGAEVPDDGDRRGFCAIAWTQGAVSTGMLAAGTTALFGGLGWMLASHAVNRSVPEHPNDVCAYSFLAELGGWLTFASAIDHDAGAQRDRDRLSALHVWRATGALGGRADHRFGGAA